jgi:hyperosmotically inducible periplasmic protein
MKKFLLVLSIAAMMALSACKGVTDADLQKSAMEKVANPAVTVAVKDGVATLTGELADQAAIDKAMAAAKVEGVKSVVVTGLKVKPTPAPIVAATNPMLKGDIEKALAAKGFKDVTVDVTTTPATLRGSYPKAKIAEVMQAAQAANGGKPVKNEATGK